MKYKMLILLTFVLFLLSGCGVSQESYDILLEQNVSLMSELESLESESEQLITENESLKLEMERLIKENESLSSQVSELEEYRKNVVMSQFENAPAIAWVKTAYGDDSFCFVSDDGSYLQCIAGNTYEISAEGLSKLWEDCKSSVALLTSLQSQDSLHQLKSDTISVKFYDPSGTYILDIIFKNNKSVSLDSLACNPLYASTIIGSIETRYND